MVAPHLEGALSLNKIYRNMKKEGHDIKIMRHAQFREHVFHLVKNMSIY